MMVDLSANLIERLDDLDQQYRSLEAQLHDPEVLADHRQVRSVSMRKAALESIVSDYRALCDLRNQKDELQSVIDTDEDAELVRMARDELATIDHKQQELIDSIQKQLVRADDQVIGSVILEIRPGVGGDEAALWAGDLVHMYESFASSKNWRAEHLETHGGERGGFRLAMLRISGDGAWAQLGYEGGTHQVKRVPETETQGRIHTSTATVAVLPEPEAVEVELNPNDVKESITTAQGPGGQNVNKVATAVHLIHEPTGIEVRMQDTKSQAQNREKAWQLLRARLFERQLAEAEAERAEARSAMIGSASRAEKIRTYRYKDNLVVDHRLGSGAGPFNLQAVVAGELQPIVDALIELDTANRLAAL